MAQPANEYGCFVCGKGKSRDLGSSCDSCGSPFDIAPDLLKIRFGGYVPVEELGRGFYGTVLLAKNQIGKLVALKACSSALYLYRGKSFTDEIAAYLEVGDHPNIAELLDGGTLETEIRGRPLTLYYLVTKYVANAMTLEKFIERERFTVEDIIGTAIQVCAAITRVEGKGLWHNDLHGRNILLAPRPTDIRDHHPAATRHEVKVVDFGSAVFSRPGPEKEFQDIQWIGRHLYSMLEAIRAHIADCSRADQWFLRQLPQLIDQATEIHPSRRFPKASELADQIELLYTKSSRHGEWQPIRLSSAFGYPNANQFPDDAYVLELFSHNFPWLSRIADGESTLLLTGPRGCGKTMILRALRLRTFIAKKRADETAEERLTRLREARAVGFFVSARLTVGLYRGLGETPAWLMSPALSNAFFNLAFLHEIASTFLYASDDGLSVMTPSEENRFCELLFQLISQMPYARPVPRVVHFSPLETIVRSLEQITSAVVDSRVVQNELPTALTGPAALSQVWSFLTKDARAFHGKRIVFLLDDFTQPLIAPACQQAYLPVMFRSADYHFIVSAHSRSVTLEDLNGVRYDRSREFTEINLGSEYVKASEHAEICEAFLDDIFPKRFRLAQAYEGKRLRDLFGDSKYHGNNVGEEIAWRHLTKKLRGLRFHGVDTLVDLCTGDVSSIIDLVGLLLRRQKKQRSTLPLPAGDQNLRIRLYARREIMKLMDIRQYDGRRLYEIATQFGVMSREKILAFAKEKRPNRADHTPQYLRIEVQQEMALRPAEEELLRALLQYGVFVDGGQGAAWDGTPTEVLIYRKLFAPVFPTTLTSRDSFSWTTAKFARFLREPRAVRYDERRRPRGEGSGSQVEIDYSTYEDAERA